jgi:hypothetical protein
MGLFDWFRSKPAANWTVGQRILAQWYPEVFFYPGVIESIDGVKYQVQFDDGDRAAVVAKQIAPMDIKVGSRVFGRWQGGPAYFPGKVDQKDGEKIHIRYDDGDEEWTTISMVRVERL